VALETIIDELHELVEYYRNRVPLAPTLDGFVLFEGEPFPMAKWSSGSVIFHEVGIILIGEIFEEFAKASLAEVFDFLENGVVEISLHATINGLGYRLITAIPMYEFGWGYIVTEAGNVIEFSFELYIDGIAFFLWYVDFAGYTAEDFYLLLERVTLLIGGDV